MNSISVDLPESLREYVEDRIAAAGYRDAGQYVLELIRADQQIRRELEPYTSGERLDQLLLDGLDSGDLGTLTAEDWERLKAPFREQVKRGEVA